MPGDTRIFYGWYIVAAICLITTITSGLAFYNLSVLLNAFVAERGFPVSLTSAATAAFFVSGGVAGVLVGRLVDRFDPRAAIVGAAVVGSACLFSVGYLRETWQLFLFHIVFGFAYGGTGLVPLTTLVTRWFSVKRSLALSLASTGLSLGGIFIAPFVALSIERGGLSATGPWMAVVFLAIVPVALFVVRSNPAVMGLEPDGGVKGANGESAQAVPSVSYAEAKRTGFFYAVSIAYLFLLGAQVGAIAHLYRLANIRNGAETAALALAFLAAASITGRLTGGWLVLRMRVRTFALELMAVQGVSLLALAFVHDRVSILAATALFGVTIGNSLMMHPLLLAEKFGTREYGRIYSMSQFIGMAGVAGGPLAIGLLYDWTGDYALPFIAGAVATIIGLFVLQFGSRR
ncbi:MAG: MFS transporter [Xanthobacteraceae bacterium]|nr:MFS transporter [Xanthobacteraceae bacterium]